MAESCCLPLVIRDFRTKYPSIEQMMSVEAAQTVQLWVDCQKWSTKASEMGHASERRELSAAAAPGKAFLHHSRQHYLDNHRLAHMQAGGSDPQAPVRLMKPESKGCEARAMGESMFAKLLPPALETKPGDCDGALCDELGKIAKIPAASLPHLLALAPPPTVAPPAALALTSGAAEDCSDPARSSRAREARRKAGLNPYFLYLNQRRREAKLRVGNRPLTLAEVATPRPGPPTMSCRPRRRKPCATSLTSGCPSGDRGWKAVVTKWPCCQTTNRPPMSTSSRSVTQTRLCNRPSSARRDGASGTGVNPTCSGAHCVAYFRHRGNKA